MWRTRLEVLAAAVAAACADCITDDKSASELPEMASTVRMASCILSCTSSRSGSTSTSALECGTLCSCRTTCKIHKAETACTVAPQRTARAAQTAGFYAVAVLARKRMQRSTCRQICQELRACPRRRGL